MNKMILQLMMEYQHMFGQAVPLYLMHFEDLDDLQAQIEQALEKEEPIKLPEKHEDVLY